MKPAPDNANGGNAVHWHDGYASRFFAWHSIGNAYVRKLGFVESSFQADNFYYGGRADINVLLSLEVQSGLTQSQLRERILLAWLALRVFHPLLLATVPDEDDTKKATKDFIITQPSASVPDAQAAAAKSVTYLNIRPQDATIFYRHLMNTGRVTEPTQSVANLYVFPLEPLPRGTACLKLAMVVCHMASDGLTIAQWTRHLIELLNTPAHVLRDHVSQALNPRALLSRLPPAQESLYPLVPGSRTRQRWFWLLMRILRHVRKPPPHGFKNPLRRTRPLDRASPMPRSFPSVLNYSPHQQPPLNSYVAAASLSSAASERLIRACRSAGTTIGAGCFALVGIAMMELHESWDEAPEGPRGPFVASFPLNGRSFFKSAPVDSCMLAFSDGIVMPFLSSDLDLEGRLKLVAKIAHRQLKAYRVRKESEEPLPWLDPHSPLRMVALNYLVTQQRSSLKVPEQFRRWTDPQGAFPANFDFSTATCGVSSIGSVQEIMARGKYKLDGKACDNGGFAADFREWTMGVRARDNEFLIACMNDVDGIRFVVSYDGNAMDEAKVSQWQGKMESILEVAADAKL